MKCDARHIEWTIGEYHARPEVARSSIEDCITTDGPALQLDWQLFKGRYIDKPPAYPRKASKALDDGNVAHACLTSPGGIADVVAVIPPEVLNAQGHRKGKAWSEWKDANAGKIQRTAGEMAAVRCMVRNVFAHPRGAWLMEHAQHYEFSLVYECPASGLPCRARPDLLVGLRGQILLVDFKTTKCLTAREFAWDMERYGYHRQFAWYKEAVELFGHTVAGCLAITVDKSPAHRVRVHEVSERAVRLGHQQNHAHRLELARRLQENDWTDPTDKQVAVIDLPERAYDWKGDVAA